MNKNIRLKIPILIILLLFLITKIISLFAYHDTWWDSAVYAGMGKYIFSYGKSGLWEASRPLVLPLMLGFLWKAGLNPLFFGQILEILFSSGCVILTYFITKKLFGWKAALISTMLFAFAPTFFRFNNILYTEMPSTFFLLLGLYFFINKAYLLSGFIFGIAFMTRFFQIFIIASLMAATIYIMSREKNPIKKSIVYIAAFLAPVMPYLLLNWMLYKNPFYPFILQAFMTQYTGWIYHKPFYFYFATLIKENYLSVFFLTGGYVVAKRGNFYQRILLISFLSAFSIYILESHKEMRIIMPLFPFFYAIAGYGVVHFSKYFKNYQGIAIYGLLLIAAFQVVPQLQFDRYDDKLDSFHKHIQASNAKDGIWISNPSFIVHSNKKADELIYYPLYNSDKAKKLQQKASKAKLVLINTCDILPCPPDDAGCSEETESLIYEFKKNLNLAYSQKIEKCRHYIFEK